MIYAVCVTLNAGYPEEVKRIKDSGIKIGDKILMTSARVGAWHTDVYLLGHKESFNSVFFDFMNENGNPYDIYNDPAFMSYQIL